MNGHEDKKIIIKDDDITEIKNVFTSKFLSSDINNNANILFIKH